MAWSVVVVLVAIGATGAPGARAASRGSNPWPDSVLCRIESHDLTLREAASAWRDAGHTAADSITPAQAGQFLDLLIAEAVLKEAARRAATAWSAEDSAAHAHLADRLALAAALDSALAESRSSVPGDSAVDALTLGMIARDRAMAATRVAFDDSAAARLARAFSTLPRPSADSSVAAQVRMLSRRPDLGAAGRAAIVARAAAGAPISAGEIVDAWALLSVAVRPRVETAEQVEDLARNLLFERALRDQATRRRLAASPAVARELEADDDQRTLTAFLQREVMARTTLDTAAARAYYLHHAADWEQPLRVRGVRLVLDDRAAAEQIAMTLRSPAAADTLEARARRHGIDYAFAVDARDSLLFRTAMAVGTGGTFGPLREGDVWWVGRVTAVEPGRVPSYADVRGDAERRWMAEDAERRTSMLAERWRRRLAVERRPDATTALARELVAHESPLGDREAGGR